MQVHRHRIDTQQIPARPPYENSDLFGRGERPPEPGHVVGQHAGGPLRKPVPPPTPTVHLPWTPAGRPRSAGQPAHRPVQSMADLDGKTVDQGLDLAEHPELHRHDRNLRPRNHDLTSQFQHCQHSADNRRATVAAEFRRHDVAEIVRLGEGRLVVDTTKRTPRVVAAVALVLVLMLSYAVLPRRAPGASAVELPPGARGQRRGLRLDRRGVLGQRRRRGAVRGAVVGAGGPRRRGAAAVVVVQQPRRQRPGRGGLVARRAVVDLVVSADASRRTATATAGTSTGRTRCAWTATGWCRCPDRSAPEREYRTERETFARIIGYGTQDDVPDLFRVWAQGREDPDLRADRRLAAAGVPSLQAGTDLDEPSLVRDAGRRRATRGVGAEPDRGPQRQRRPRWSTR